MPPHHIKKKQLYSLSGSPRAYHYLIHYLCLLPSSISLSRYLSSNTRYIFKHLLFFLCAVSQRCGHLASYLIDLFQTLPSNLLCPHIEVKLGCYVMCRTDDAPKKLLCLPMFALSTSLDPLLVSCLNHTTIFKAGAIFFTLLLWVSDS